LLWLRGRKCWNKFRAEGPGFALHPQQPYFKQIVYLSTKNLHTQNLS
jgi:dihydrofolate reductase